MIPVHNDPETVEPMVKIKEWFIITDQVRTKYINVGVGVIKRMKTKTRGSKSLNMSWFVSVR